MWSRKNNIFFLIKEHLNPCMLKCIMPHLFWKSLVVLVFLTLDEYLSGWQINIRIMTKETRCWPSCPVVAAKVSFTCKCNLFLLWHFFSHHYTHLMVPKSEYSGFKRTWLIGRVINPNSIACLMSPSKFELTRLWSVFTCECFWRSVSSIFEEKQRVNISDRYVKAKALGRPPALCLCVM